MTEKQEAYSKYISAMAELLLHEKYSVDEITEILKDEWEAAYENAGYRIMRLMSERRLPICR